MKKLIKYMILIIICFWYYSCDVMDTRLIIVNETNRTIFFKWQEDTILNKYSIITQYKSFPPDSKTGEYPLNVSAVVLSDSFNYVSIWTYRGWDKYFRKNKYLYLFIFDSDTLNLYSWDSIRANQKFLKRFDLTLNDIKKANWIIKYSERE